MHRFVNVHGFVTNQAILCETVHIDESGYGPAHRKPRASAAKRPHPHMKKPRPAGSEPTGRGLYAWNYAAIAACPATIVRSVPSIERNPPRAEAVIFSPAAVVIRT